MAKHSTSSLSGNLIYIPPPPSIPATVGGHPWEPQWEFIKECFLKTQRRIPDWRTNPNCGIAQLVEEHSGDNYRPKPFVVQAINRYLKERGIKPIHVLMKDISSLKEYNDRIAQEEAEVKEKQAFNQRRQEALDAHLRKLGKI